MIGTPRPSLRQLARLSIAAALAIALTGCLKVDMDLTVESQTLSGSMVVAVDAEATEMLGMEPEDVFSDPGEDGSADLEGVSAVPYADGDWVGVEYVFDRVDLADLHTIPLADDDEFPTIVYHADEESYEFSLVLDFTEWFGDPELSEEDLDIPGLDPAVLQERFEAAVSVTFPGEVTEHNGQLSGTTVSWRPEPGERTEMHAVALASGPGGSDPAGSDDPAAGLPGLPGTGGGSTSTGTALLVALIVLVLAAAAGVGLWLVLRHRGLVAAPAGAATATLPTTDATVSTVSTAGTVTDAMTDAAREHDVEADSDADVVPDHDADPDPDPDPDADPERHAGADTDEQTGEGADRPSPPRD